MNDGGCTWAIERKCPDTSLWQINWCLWEGIAQRFKRHQRIFRVLSVASTVDILISGLLESRPTFTRVLFGASLTHNWSNSLSSRNGNLMHISVYCTPCQWWDGTHMREREREKRLTGQRKPLSWKHIDKVRFKVLVRSISALHHFLQFLLFTRNVLVVFSSWIWSYRNGLSIRSFT